MICSICLFTGKRGDVTDGGADRDDPVTVMNGQAVCADHAGLVGNSGKDRHYMITMEVRMRVYESLAALQAAQHAARRAVGQ